ncbi:hypothetical protein LCGC14_0547870 [marine sediment metagenome]|uniref:Uncharacterized protein n=1 Tax=marine sediment metagenome TaxID=412755 RepID=A0A0F9RQZ1_9ZZZZ
MKITKAQLEIAINLAKDAIISYTNKISAQNHRLAFARELLDKEEAENGRLCNALMAHKRYLADYEKQLEEY